jgi:hypothetical protein
MKAKKQTQKDQQTTAVSVTNVPLDLVRAVRQQARANHRSLAGHIRALLEQAVEEVAI